MSAPPGGEDAGTSGRSLGLRPPPRLRTGSGGRGAGSQASGFRRGPSSVAGPAASGPAPGLSSSHPSGRPPPSPTSSATARPRPGAFPRSANRGSPGRSVPRAASVRPSAPLDARSGEGSRPPVPSTGPARASPPAARSASSDGSPGFGVRLGPGSTGPHGSRPALVRPSVVSSGRPGSGPFPAPGPRLGWSGRPRPGAPSATALATGPTRGASATTVPGPVGPSPSTRCGRLLAGVLLFLECTRR